MWEQTGSGWPRSFQCEVCSPVPLRGGLGYRPHIEKSEAIQTLAAPTSVKEVRSFLGLANSFRNFMPKLSHNLDNIRKLLSKNAVFIWTELHQKEFEYFKIALNGPLGLGPFEKGMITQLWVDFSKSGMGLVLTQTNPKDEKDKRVIWCDFTSLTPAQSRYSSIYGLGYPEVPVLVEGNQPLFCDVRSNCSESHLLGKQRVSRFSRRAEEPGGSHDGL